MPHPRPVSRRQFGARVVGLTALAAASGTCPSDATAATPAGRMKISLNPGSIGVSANQQETIDLAARHGFEAAEPFGGPLASMNGAQFDAIMGSLQSHRLAWGAAGLSTDFRRDDATFAEGMKHLPREAAALAKAGARRIGTWLAPGHSSLTYLQNFRLHVLRLREIAHVLKDHGLRLGLEYVGTATLRQSRRHPFIHTLAETRELIAEIGAGNVGIVLDSWHWWTAGDAAEEIHALKPDDVVSVDLNDAPAGVPKEQQIDNRRELPGATGVIDVATFLGALERIGYDGPVRAEPFNRTLNDLDNDAACATTIRAMRKTLRREP